MCFGVPKPCLLLDKWPQSFFLLKNVSFLKRRVRVSPSHVCNRWAQFFLKKGVPFSKGALWVLQAMVTAEQAAAGVFGGCFFNDMIVSERLVLGSPSHVYDRTGGCRHFSSPENRHAFLKKVSVC